MDRIGELAAFGTALCWTASAIFFEGASKRVGALAVNFYKVVFAFLLLGIAGSALRGMPLPLDAPLRAWFFLALSGVIGFVIADYFLFNAYILISSRVTVIFQALTPLFAAIFGYLILGERMRPGRVAAMALVIAGIVLVVGSRNSGRGGSSGPRPKGASKGYVFAFLSSIFQALGLVFSKFGLGSYDAVSGTQIRVMTAVIGFAAMALLTRQALPVFGAMRDAHARKITIVGSVFGPFLGVVLSLVALQNADAGAASTLMALTPVLIIAPAVIIQKQKVALAEILGAALAVSGAALFFLI
jgi:drug/metabolite transporter (DMT)-like permease